VYAAVFSLLLFSKGKKENFTDAPILPPRRQDARIAQSGAGKKDVGCYLKVDSGDKGLAEIRSCVNYVNKHFVDKLNRLGACKI
jgi:hypothetical protein